MNQMNELLMEVAALKQWVNESREDRKHLHAEMALLRESNIRLCTVLEALEKKLCPMPGACLSIQKEVTDLKAFKDKTVGGIAILTTVGTICGIVGGWLINAYWHHVNTHKP
jgi:regulator of replication initiation timing